MQGKFDNCREDYNKILVMGAILDPKLKLEVLEKAYESLDPTIYVLKILVLNDNLEMLYKDYQTRKLANSLTFSATPTPYEIINESPFEEDVDNVSKCFRMI